MSKKITTVAVDEGSNQIKVCWMDEENIQTFVIPSIIQDEPGTDSIGDLLEGNYEVDGESYFVSPNIQNPLPTKRKGYQTSVENRVLIHEALRLAGFGGKQVNVVCTLPIGQFFMGEGHNRDKDLLALKKRNVTGAIKCSTGAELADIVDVAVAPESVPAWFDMLFDDTMDQDEAMYDAQMVMIIDIGGTTTDICLIDGSAMLQSKRTVEKGVYDIANNLRTLMIEAKKAKSLPRVHLDAVLRNGEYRGFNCLDMIKAASKQLVKEIHGQMDDLVSDSESLDHILYVGGGAALIGEELASRFENLKNTHIPSEPDLVVSRGLLKLKIAQTE